jgi:hypothetical protein
MRKLRAIARRILGTFRFWRPDADFDAELESHVAMHIDDGVRAGLSREEASRQAILSVNAQEPAAEMRTQM